MSWHIGERVGAYTLEKKLGQGGMATVYKAYHEQLDRHVAIKVIHPNFVNDENFVVRFRREAQIVAKLEHPHIVPVYDYSEQDNQPYLVMKYIEGQTLKDAMQAHSPSMQEISRIMHAVSDALDYAHERGVLHRDIKPSNIMLLGKEETPYLADFGLARLAKAGESTLSADMLLGTPHYISPEQARGSRSLDGRTDVYSLGIVLYEMLVGHVPFTGDTPFAIIHDHIYRPLPKPSLIHADIPERVESVLLKALAKHPDDRYEAAGAMMADFDEAIEETGWQELDEDRATIAMQSLMAAREQYERDMSQSDTGYAGSQVRTITENVVPSTKAGTPTPILDRPTPTTTTRSASTSTSFATMTAAQKRRRFWQITGCGSFLFLSFISIAILLSISSTVIELFTIANTSDPSNNILQALGTEFREIGIRINQNTDYLTFEIPRVPLEIAERIAENNPEDALSYLILAQAYWQNAENNRAYVSIREGVGYAENAVFYLANASQIAIANDDGNAAVGYGVIALVSAEGEDYDRIEDDGYAFLYQQAQVSGIQELVTVLRQLGGNDLTDETIRTIGQSTPSRFFMAQKLLNDGNIRTTRLLIDNLSITPETRDEIDFLQLQLLIAERSVDAPALAGDILNRNTTPEWIQDEINNMMEEGILS
jgi:serine/threonine protein kinase